MDVIEPVFLHRSSDFVVGVDLGQATDPSAIAVIEHVRGVLDSGSKFERHTGLSGRKQKPVEYFDVRHLERLPLGLSYPNVVRCVRELMERDPLERATLVLDETGVGRAVADLFVTEGLDPKRVTITAGLETTHPGRDRWHVGKGTLVSNLDALLHRGVLRFASTLHEADTMRTELLDFRRQLSAVGRASYNARAGKHDDLVLAVCIACWWLSRPLPPMAETGLMTFIKQEPRSTSGFTSRTTWSKGR
jgi:hypothetical protein